MKKVILFNLLLATCFLIPLSQSVVANESPPKIQATLQQLKKNSGGTLEINWNNVTNTPFKLTGKLTLPSKHSPEWIAYEFLYKWRTLYGLQNPKRDMKVIEVERRHDIINVRLQHLLFRTPVWEDWLVIEIRNDGVIQQIEGTIHPYLEKQLFNRPMHPAISKKQAIGIARANVQGELANAPEVETYYLSARSGTPLIYAVTLQHFRPDRRTTILIHSVTGRIIEHNN
ncbi:hypothetical protein [Cohnella sp.]|uniref:hypothetical protein n=1 Tax=Cohnella sp. TaxID=1883426 RepID=UPI003565AF3F